MERAKGVEILKKGIWECRCVPRSSRAGLRKAGPTWSQSWPCSLVPGTLSRGHSRSWGRWEGAEGRGRWVGQTPGDVLGLAEFGEVHPVLLKRTLQGSNQGCEPRASAVWCESSLCVSGYLLPRLNPTVHDIEALVNDHNRVSRQQTQLPMVHSPAWFQRTDNTTWCLAQPGSTTQPPEVKLAEIIFPRPTLTPPTIQHLPPRSAKTISVSHWVQHASVSDTHSAIINVQAFLLRFSPRVCAWPVTPYFVT